MGLTPCLRNISICSRWNRWGSDRYFERSAFSCGCSACICFIERMLFSDRG